MRRLYWIAGAGALCFALAGVFLCSGLTLPAAAQLAQLKDLVFAHAPSVPFDPAAAPPAPDYALATAWAARPEVPNPSNAAPAGVTIADQAAAPADVFFIHPTTDLKSDHWNGDVNDADLNARTDRGTIANQASVFNGCCRVFAPRYRQMTIGGFLAHSADSDKALDLAYTDVKRAFVYYLEHDNRGRPFILASHSQGSRLATRLVKEMIDGTPLMHRFVAAYIVGTWLPDEYFTALKDVKVCQRSDDTGCVLTWSTLANDADGQKQRADFVKRSGLPPEYANRHYVCTNPISWTASDAVAPAADNLGGWVRGQGEQPRAADPHLVSARCDDGGLFISEPPERIYRLLVLPGGNYHNMDYQLFYMNIRDNAKTRVAAFLVKAR